MILSLSRHIEPRVAERPEGYKESILSRATRIDGDEVELPDDAYQELCSLYRDGPTLPQLLANFAGAMARWVSAGLPRVTKAQFESRHVTCLACPHWTGTTCRKCGCTKLKLWLATETCPDGRWKKVETPAKGA